MRGYKNFESDPHPGDLRHLVEIGYTQNTINGNGYPEPKDVVICKVWAACTDAGNQHYRAADVMNTEQVINFTIRYRSDIKPGMWVRFRGEKWDISAGRVFFQAHLSRPEGVAVEGSERMSKANPEREQIVDLPRETRAQGMRRARGGESG